MTRRCLLLITTLFLLTGVGCQPGQTDASQGGPAVANPNADPLFAGRRLSEWFRLLESDDDFERLGAARSLGDMGADAAGAVPSLIKSLSDRDPFIQSAAAASLGEIGPAAASAIPAMVKAFKISSGFHKGIIGPAIGQIGPQAIPALVELSKDSNEFVRLEATRALRFVGQGTGAAEARLIELLNDKDSSVRVEAGFTLWKLFGRQSVIDLFSRALADPDENARACAADYLAELGPAAAPALPALIHALADTSGSVRNRSTTAIGKIGPGAKPAVPALLLATSHSGHRPFFEKAIKGIGPEAIPALIDGLGQAKGLLAAVESLGRFGAASKAAVPRLRVLLKSSRGEPRVTLALALWRIEHDDSVVAPLGVLARTDNFIVQLHALGALEEIGPGAKSAIPVLVEMLNGNNRFMREYAAKALGSIGPEAKTAIPALEKMLKEPELANRIAAGKALWQIGRSKVGLTSLMNDARNWSDMRTSSAVMALGEIGPDAGEAVPALIEAFNTDTIYGKALVAQTLAKMGPQAKAAIPRLLEIYNDIHNTVRASFAKSIKAIDPEAADRAGIR